MKGEGMSSISIDKRKRRKKKDINERRGSLYVHKRGRGN